MGRIAWPVFCCRMGDLMSEVEQTEQDLKALEAFIVNNPDLERLEALLDRFNIFEAIGVVRQELRHSDFLAFLLDPQENHGLGDAFIKRLLQQVLMSTPDVSAPVTPVELSLWDLDRMGVQREWQRIDIFLMDEQNRLAIIVENKVDTGEHSDQLQRYYETVRQHYPDYKVISLYLTPAGDEPSHEAYLPLSYGLVCEVLDSLADSQLSVLNTDLQILITHYTGMLRRHIVGDSEIARLSRRIYRKHQRAIDVILEHRPDRQDLIRQILEDLVNEQPNLVLDHPGKGKMQFALKDWDTPINLSGSGWTTSGRILMFETVNDPKFLDVKLLVGPGEASIRKGFFQAAKSNGEPFNVARKLAKKHNTIYSRRLASQPLLEESEFEGIEQEIRKNWADFLENDLPQIDAALKQESWIWQEPDESE